MFNGEQDEPEDRVLYSLNDRYRNTFANLTVVVDAEPLVGEMAAAVHHELGTQHSTEGPPDDQCRYEGVGEGGE